MTPATTGKGRGNLEFDRRFPGVGRIRCSSGVPKPRVKPGTKMKVPAEFHRRNAILTKLYETSQLEVLRAFRDRLITIEQLVELDRHGRGGETLAMVKVRAPLWATVEQTLPLMGRAKGTRDRYALSFKQLRAQCATLHTDATVADLARVEWTRLEQGWEGGPADWNRMRTAVSRLLSIVTGDKYSAFRREIVKRIPELEEPEGRTPDLTPDVFLRLRDRVARMGDDDVVAALMAFVITGWRAHEYLSVDKTCLRPATHRVRIPPRAGNKTGGRVVSVDPEDWPWIAAAVPFAGLPVPDPQPDVESDPRYRRIWKHWRAAQVAEGLVDKDDKVLNTIHDLRHCAGQWASDAGISDRAVQQLLGHKSPLMTAKYTKQRDARSASAAVGRVLKLSGGSR